MVEYMDFGHNLQGLVDALSSSHKDDFQGPDVPTSKIRRPNVDKSFYEVRKSICVAGYFWDAVRDVKHKIANMMTEPCPLESFHVKDTSDIYDGVLLVPKIILVGVHCPGRKLIDEEEDSGQLDLLYDEACRVGADLMVVYLGLSRAIYTPVKHAIYHPKMEDMVFPSQPLLRHLANQNCFVTVCEPKAGETMDFTNIQKNVIKEWMDRPVTKNHPVYQAADYIAAAESKLFEEDYEVIEFERKPDPPEVEHKPATEEHPLADKKKKKKSRLFGFRNLKRREGRPGYARLELNLGTLEEAIDEKETSVEMNIYKTTEQALESGGGEAAGTVMF